MKIMTCKQLGGACDEEFSAETWEEMAEMSRAHGMKMHEEGDESHKAAMAKMGEMMQDPEAMQKWMTDKEEEFNNLPDNS